MKILSIVAALSVLGGIDCAKILAFYPLPYFSHVHAFYPVFKELAARGHHITMVSPFPQEKPIANWTDIVINKKPFDDYYSEKLDTYYAMNRYTFYPVMIGLTGGQMDIAYEDKALQNLIKDTSLKFDLIIAEPLFYQESFAALSHRFNVPLLQTYPLPLSAWEFYLFGNELKSAYLPNLRTSYSDRMNFFQRLDNFIVNIIEIFSAFYYNMPHQEELLKKYMVYPGSSKRPPLIELLKNIPMTLLDGHYAVDYAKPEHLNIISVGGLSLKTNKNLPNDLKKIMDESPNGVVYLSFGGIVRVSSVKKPILDAIIKTLGNLKFKVLMKWEKDTFPNKPANIEARKWFPQNDILAHPNCRLFITHGGMHSLIEAAHYGIPVVGIPFFSDQDYNMKFAEEAGFGIAVLRNEFTEDKFKNAVDTVLSNSTYKENAVKRSRIVMDRPQTPLEQSVFWIEYVMRHKDLSHLRQASADLPFYQIYLLDVIGFLILVSLVGIVIVVILSKFIVKMFTRGTKPIKRKRQ